MQDLKFMLLLIGALGLWSCTPKVAKTMETKPSADGSEIVEAMIKLPHPPVSIDGGIQMNYLYAGMPNDITINVQGGSSAHLVVEATNGTLRPADVTKGRYSFYYKYPGIVVEIYAKDTINNVTVAEAYEVVPMPAPSAFVWTARTPLPKEDPMDMDAITFRAQNSVILRHNFRVPVRCAPNSFQITRITSKGQRSTHLNEDGLGKFDEQAMAMVQAAQSGDIYVIENIKSPCSPKLIKNIVYTIK